MYLNRSFGTTKIASHYNCSKAAILIKLHKFGIDVRNTRISHVRPLKNELEELYLKQKLSTWKIGKICGCSRATIHRKLKYYNIERRSLAEAEIKYPRNPFNGDLKEKAYLIGFAMGDLRVVKPTKDGNTISVKGGTTQLDQVNLFSSIFSKYGRVWNKRAKNGRYNFQALLDLSFSFLLDSKNELEWIQENPEHFLAFLAGFTDAEGSIFITNKQAVYSIGNYDQNILTLIQENLKKHFNIDSKVYCDNKIRMTSDGYKKNDFYKILRIQRKHILYNLFELLDEEIKHQKRIKQMKIAKQNIEMRGLISKQKESA